MPGDPSVKVAECCSVEVTDVSQINETTRPPSHSSSSQARCTAGMRPLFLSRLTKRTMISLTSQMRLRSGCRGVLALVTLRLLRSAAPLCPSKLPHRPLFPGRGEPLDQPCRIMLVEGLTYGIPYKGEMRIQVSHRFGALQYTRLVMLAARDRTTIVLLTMIFAVAHLGFVSAWSIPFGFERCAAPVGSLMLVLISPAPMPSG